MAPRNAWKKRPPKNPPQPSPELETASHDPSGRVTPDAPCDRCKTDETTDPCDRCPLYFAWLERRRFADEPGRRDEYRTWLGRGGWRLLWGVHRIGRVWERVRAAREVLTLFPRLRERRPDYEERARKE